MHDFLKTIALHAGQLAMEFRQRIDHLQIDYKTEKDLVTEADKAIEAYLVDAIRERYPDHAITGEESGSVAGNRFRWVIDPIDGTAGFVHDQPYFSVSIALQEDGETIAGSVYAPAMSELFLAFRGQGAELNGKAIRVSSRTRLADSMLATGFACIRSGLAENNLPYFNALLPKLRDVRRYGSAALDLCYVAAGRLEGFWELNLNDYDVAAGVLILEEAGGVYTDFSGTQKHIYAENLASNRAIHQDLLAVLAEVRSARA